MGADEPEVVVVGGGPAGLVTATALAGRGHRVVVLERGEPGRDKACGEGLMPDAVRALSRLGIDLADAGHPFRGIRYLDGGTVAEGDFPGEPGRGIRRTRLHRRLAEAAERAGAEIRWGRGATGVRAGEVTTTDGVLRPRWIVAADGLHSKLRREAGLDDPPTRGRLRYGVRRHYAIPPWSERVEVSWADGAEAYVTPVDRDLVGVAVLWSGGTASFDELLPRFPALRERLAGAEPASRDRGAGAFRQRPRRVVAGNLLLVGDASGYVDPVTGEGMGLAFRQAESLAEALDRGDPGRYAAAQRRLSRRAWAAARVLLLLEPRPRLRRSVIRVLGAVPGLFSGILAWITRD